MSNVIMVNGVRLVYENGGSGTAIVSLHGGPGMGSQASDWSAFQPPTDHYRLVSYDQRGNGEGCSHAQVVTDLEARRQNQGLGKFVE